MGETDPAGAVDVFNDRFGRHPRRRALHAKGIWCRGSFTAAPAGARAVQSAHLQGGLRSRARSALERGRQPERARLRARRPRPGGRLRAAGRLAHRPRQPERSPVLLLEPGGVHRLRPRQHRPLRRVEVAALLRHASRRRCARCPTTRRRCARSPASPSCRFYGVHAFRWVDARRRRAPRSLRLAAGGGASARLGGPRGAGAAAATTCSEGLQETSMPARSTLDVQIAEPRATRRRPRGALAGRSPPCRRRDARAHTR